MSEDIEFHAWPLKRQGGQHTNASTYGVLAVHTPSGIAALSVDERSQYANREKVVAIIRRARQVALSEEERAALEALTFHMRKYGSSAPVFDDDGNNNALAAIAKVLAGGGK